MKHYNFAGKLHRLTRLLTTLSEHRWASDGYKDIKVAHLQALIKLIEGNFNNNQLAALSSLTKQSMNRLTKELLQTGYIVNAANQSLDGRIKLFTLSDKGKMFIKYLHTTHHDLEIKLTEVLEAGKFDQFNQTLDILLNFVEERHQST